MPEPLTAEATIKAAFEKLKQSVSTNDASVFQSTELEDVWKAAEAIEKAQRAGRAMRNMGKIKPLLSALEKYSTALGVLCNGTPYLPWAWVSGENT